MALSSSPSMYVNYEHVRCAKIGEWPPGAGRCKRATLSAVCKGGVRRRVLRAFVVLRAACGELMWRSARVLETNGSAAR